MNEWILKAMGAEVDDVDAISSWSLRWNLEPWGILAGCLLVVLIIVAWWAYRKRPQDVKPARRGVLTVVRVAFFALLLAILLQPVLVLTLERDVPRTLPVLVDTTGSMKVTDGGAGTRLANVGETLESADGREVMASLEEALSVAPFTFTAEDVAAFGGDWSALEAGGEATALGDTLARVLERYRGASLAGLVVFTDGGQNHGRPLAEASSMT